MNRKAKKLNKENNEQDKVLNGEYQSVMTDMVCYLRGANISDYDVELIRRDLLEMFIDAEKRKENIREVIGDDYEEFCDNILNSVPKKTKTQQFLAILSTIFLCIGIIGLIKTFISETSINIIRTFFRGDKPNLNMAVSWGDLISSLLLILVVSWFVNWVCKNAFKTSENKSKARDNSVVVFVGAFVVFSIIMLTQYFFRSFIVFYMPIYIMLIVSLLILVVSKLIDEIN